MRVNSTKLKADQAWLFLVNEHHEHTTTVHIVALELVARLPSRTPSEVILG